MLKPLFAFLLFFTFTLTHGQKKRVDFPKNALGIYKGVLKISNQKGKQSIPMEFHLQKTDSTHKFKYVLVYNKTPRNYTLVVKDAKKGLFEIDENNGIILPCKYDNNTLFSFFEVQGNFLSTRLHFKKETLDFEILFTAKKNKVTSGGKSKEIPIVYGFPITTIQIAELKKVE